MKMNVNYNGATLILKEAPEALPYELIEPSRRQYAQAFAYDSESEEEFLLLWKITSSDFLKDFALRDDTCDWSSPIVLRKIDI
ncbi:hypothetical protein B7C51_25070 (plasmid) [Paenibacillus larvae subsp. pulvifaciens]|uniref:Uncharacterized protein n=1 Tax=Paenibacillus larvae subsp. pulvifaciens TaxID=1477 RepID=A0A1V0V014_9BACL|nr:hypothetical protein [Paenibacillus larvae]ARF70746.1 hypothetical protein B7C51_25070 [Paenibacillus larvae subsp. pulvifaciens]